MSYQRCPICNGSGLTSEVSYNYSFMYTTKTCEVCNGTKIISELTGKPPIDEKKEL